MISYFKYTNGEAFTLDGVDYRGMVNVKGDTAYTRAMYGTDSKLLSSKESFMAASILNRSNFDYTSESNLSKTLSSIEVYPRSILNINTITGILDTLNKNNIALYSAGVCYDQNYFNLLFKTLDTLPTTYCLSAYGSMFNNVPIPLYKIPFDVSGLVLYGVDSPVNARNSLFVASSGSFKYYNNGGLATGSLTTSTVPTFSTGLQSTQDFAHKYLNYDMYNSVIYQTNSSNFSIFTYNYKSASNVIALEDKIDSSSMGITTGQLNSSYGKNYRTVIAMSLGAYTLEVYKVRSSKLLRSFNPGDLGLDNIILLSQRFEDDILLIYGTKNDAYVLVVCDIPTLVNSGQILSINNINGIVANLIELSPFDSDIAIFKTFAGDGTLSSLEFRSITHPLEPITTYESGTLVPIRVNDIIEQINVNVNACNDYVLGSVVASKVNDIAFNVSETVNSVIIYNDSIVTNTNNIFAPIQPLTLHQNYSTSVISDSSIGLTINNALKTIIQDTLSIYYHYTKRKQFSNSVSTGNVPTMLKDVTTDNLAIYGNEGINVSVLNRVIKKVLQLQQYLGSSIDTK